MKITTPQLDFSCETQEEREWMKEAADLARAQPGISPNKKSFFDAIVDSINAAPEDEI